MDAADRPGRDEMLDALLDLSHDLGKYLRMPLAMLPAEAGPGDVREALEHALRRTRVGPRGVRGAREIWAGFHEECAAALAGRPGFDALAGAVARALAWERAIDGVEEIDRAALTRDFADVSRRIRELIEEVSGG